MVLFVTLAPTFYFVVSSPVSRYSATISPECGVKRGGHENEGGK